MFTVTPTTNAACCTPRPADLISWWRAESNATTDWMGRNGTDHGPGLTYGPGKVGQAFYFTNPTAYARGNTTGFSTGSAARTIEQ